MNFRSLKYKIIVSTILCIAIVGVFSYTFLYRYLTGMVADKAESIEAITLETVQRRLNSGFTEFYHLALYASNNYDIARGATHQNRASLRARQDGLRAQEQLNSYLSSGGLKNSRGETYIEKMIVFNQHEVMIQAYTRNSGLQSDPEKVRELDIFRQVQQGEADYGMALSPSIVAGVGECIAIVYPISYMGLPQVPAWLYMELNTDFMADILEPYAENGIFVAQPSTGKITAVGGRLPEGYETLEGDKLAAGEEYPVGDQVFRLSELTLAYTDMNVYSLSDITMFVQDNVQVGVIVGVVALTSVAAVLLLAVAVALFVTRPLQRLTSRIKKISENDFSYDPAIEKGGDEIAAVGKVINEMNVSIGRLLQETEEMYEQRKNAEIALLQSQVNPHFLYNTLDSIRWMAVIQNNPGIAKTVRSLSNLLKNLAKGTGDKITLAQEISLLQDYADTQSIRFMEMFELQNDIEPDLLQYRIVKFTLQPLVENAIFHGIEPSEGCGVIRLWAEEEEDDLLLMVEDNGVGMTEEELGRLMKAAENPHPGGMASIGVANVNNRLKLTYGAQYGLSYQSEVGQFTRVTIRIPKEE